MNFQKYLQLIHKAVQSKSGVDLRSLLPFANFNKIIPAEILKEIKDLPQVSTKKINSRRIYQK
jgi:hypothetical protein